MEKSIEYQIFIGCNDPYVKEEIVRHQELSSLVSDFFERNEIDFSMLNCQGGYKCEDGSFVFEESICINIIGDEHLDIVKLAKSLSMYMNQEGVLIVRSPVQISFR